MSQPIYVIKFGGSVLSDAEGFRNAANYVKSKRSREVIVVPSAMYEVSSTLEKIYENRSKRRYVSRELGNLERRYIKTLEPLPPELAEPAKSKIKIEMGNLERDITTGAKDAVEGSGEGHSCIIFVPYLKSAGLDAEYVLGSDAGFMLDGQRRINLKRSTKRLSKTVDSILRKGEIPVIGPYLGEAIGGGYIRAPRNSNDEFATAIAVAKKIDGVDDILVEIVKDVAGVYRVEERYGDYGVLKNLSYDESGKLTWRGSPVVYPTAITMAENNGITIVVKNMDSPGTIISKDSQTTKEKPVAAIVTSQAPIVTVLDRSMDTGEESLGYLATVTGFEAANRIPIGVDASDAGKISHTLSPGNKKGKEKEELEKMLRKHPNLLKKYLISHGYQPEGVYLEEKTGVITLVGNEMQNRKGTLAYLSGIVGDAGISIRAASQSYEKPSPPSITFVVDIEDLDTSVKALCEELFGK